VLVLAIDFPDYRTGSITKEETDMWYEDYPKSHFQDMVFGENGYKGPDDNDIRPRSLVFEALTKAAQDPNVDLSEYDAWDRDDYDGNGEYAEPDGLIDHLMVIHVGVGEEAGGGSLGGDAIWSHRSKLSTGP
jgi:immune inhibitor A